MIVFVDGENFRQSLANILYMNGMINDKSEMFRYDVMGLIKDALKTDDLEVYYYSSMIKTPRGYEPSEAVLNQISKIRENMRRWVAMLKRQGIIYVKAGSLKIKEGKSCHICHAKQEHLQEKGVDVRLALDIFEKSLEKDVKKIAVISSDTDICPAYHKIAERNVTVIYICFEYFLNRAVSAATSETIMITNEQVLKFFKG